jgi:hypothetical protein
VVVWKIGGQMGAEPTVPSWSRAMPLNCPISGTSCHSGVEQLVLDFLGIAAPDPERDAPGDVGEDRADHSRTLSADHRPAEQSLFLAKSAASMASTH